MDVQCEQRNCGKTVDLHDEAVFCRRCQKYVCEGCYTRFHEDHDTLAEQEPKWAITLQR
jgi:hypothetical protein